MTAAAWHSRALMRTFQPQSVANMIWAYATLAHQPPEPFLHVLCHHTMHDLPNFSPQNISNTVWALATLKYPCEVSYSQMSSEVSQDFHQELAGCMGICRTVKLRRSWCPACSPNNHACSKTPIASPACMKGLLACIVYIFLDLICHRLVYTMCHCRMHNDLKPVRAVCLCGCAGPDGCC